MQTISIASGNNARKDTSDYTPVDNLMTPIDDTRLVEVINWIWMPYVSQTRRWEPDEFVIRWPILIMVRFCICPTP